MWNVGLSSCGKNLSEELFMEYEKAGITHIEISPTPKEYPVLPYEDLKKWSKKYHVVLWSLHLPFYPNTEVNIATSNEELRVSSVNYLSDIIRKASKVGIFNFILHASSEPIEVTERHILMAQSKKSIKELCSICEECGAVLCVENLPRTCLGRTTDELLDLLSIDPRLCACFDTNHFLYEPWENMFLRCENRIRTLHVSDYDFVNERHWLPGEGDIDWKKFANYLKKIHYTGPFLYEIDYKASKSILRDRDLVAADFRKNADEIMNGKPPKALGRKASPMPFWN